MSDLKRPPSVSPPSPSAPGGTGPRVTPSVRPPGNIRDALTEARAISGGASVTRSSSRPGSVAPAAKKTVLIVDDDAAMRARLREGLAPYYEVVEAKDGMEAVEMTGKMPPPAMVVSDVVMPRLDGFTLAKILRSNPVLKKVPIMFVSSRNSPQDVTQALVLGACQYVPKTTAISEIVSKIRKIVV
jgi:CheY-like chemotaxis protein